MNHGVEFGKKKDGFVSNGISDLIGKRKKDGSQDKQWNRIY